MFEVLYGVTLFISIILGIFIVGKFVAEILLAVDEWLDKWLNE